MDQRQTQGNAFNWASDDESSSNHNVDSCPSGTDMRVEPPPSQFMGYTNDIEPLLAQLVRYADNTETVPSQIPGYADSIEPLPSELLGYTDNIGPVDMTPEAPPSRDLHGEGAVGHMAQPQSQPSASTSTQGVMDGSSKDVLQVPVQPSQPQMSRAEAKMEEDIRFAEALIPGKETSKSGEGKGKHWSISFKRTICGYIEEHYGQNSETIKQNMIRAIYDTRQMDLRNIPWKSFRDRTNRMIDKYLEHRHRMSDADQDENKKGQLIVGCPYFYHMHKALSYSKAYGGQSAAQLDSQLSHIEF